ncbi:MAG: hypothetical protein Q4F24_01810 [Eubacteriales bacterium]|nr:hypothetical protein [Eubacteriales bacterium]
MANPIKIEEGEHDNYYRFTPEKDSGYFVYGPAIKLLKEIQDENGNKSIYDNWNDDDPNVMVSLKKGNTYILHFQSRYHDGGFDDNSGSYSMKITSIIDEANQKPLLREGENKIEAARGYYLRCYKLPDSNAVYKITQSVHPADYVSMNVWYNGEIDLGGGNVSSVIMSGGDCLMVGVGNSSIIPTTTITVMVEKITPTIKEISSKGKLPEISVMDYLEQIPGEVSVTFTDPKTERKQITYSKLSYQNSHITKLFLKDLDERFLNYPYPTGTFDLCAITSGVGVQKLGKITVNPLKTEKTIDVDEAKNITQSLYDYYLFEPEYTSTYQVTLENQRKDENVSLSSATLKTYMAEQQEQQEEEKRLVLCDEESEEICSGSALEVRLESGKKYYVGSRGNNVEDGEAIMLTMKENLIQNADVDPVPAQTYTGTVIRPKPTVRYGKETLTEGKDYRFFYEDNKNLGTATMIITGEGDYVGTKEITFNIIQPTSPVVPPVTPEVIEKSLEKIAFMEAIPDQAYTGKAIEPEAVVRLKDGNEQLKKDVDYTVSYSSNIEPGTVHVTVTGKGDYTGTLEGTFAITGKMPQTIAVDARQVKGLKNRTMSDKPATIRYTEAPKTSVTYSSSNKKVATVDEKGVIRYVGTGTAVITAKAKETELYEGAQIKLTVNVGLKKVSFTPIGYNDKFRVTTNTVKGAVKWQVQYSTKKNFADAKTKTYTSAGRLYRQYVKAGDKTTYYIRIRAIRGNYKSGWSDAKKVTTK